MPIRNATFSCPMESSMSPEYLHTINGLLSLKKTKVILLKDVVRGLEILDEEGLISQFQSKRVAICQLAQLIEILKSAV